MPAIPPTIVGEAGSPVPNDVTTVRTRVTSPVPFVKADASVYGEVEMDTQDADRRVIAVGGNYVLPNHGKVYFRHEFISSLTGPYGLNEQQRQNTIERNEQQQQGTDDTVPGDGSQGVPKPW